MSTEATPTTTACYLTAGWTAAWLARYLDLALASLEISMAQYRLLVLLAQGEDASGSLARKLSVSPPSVTNVVDGLVQRGSVVRTPSSEDRRRISLALTDAGRDLLERAEAAIEARFASIAAALGDPAATRAAFAGLELWADALDNRRRQRRAERDGHERGEQR